LVAGGDDTTRPLSQNQTKPYSIFKPLYYVVSFYGGMYN
jgi:hypothetical protein